MTKGYIFDIKRYAIHDGPGIRTTVFFKGCSLRCQWCHNPEGIETSPEIITHQKRCYKGCRDCISVCPKEAIAKKGKTIYIDESKCDFCSLCSDNCVFDAIEISGSKVSPEDVIEEIEKDKVFYDSSGGGVTLSGGEPLEQIDFLDSLLEELKKRGYHTVLDTSGHASFSDIQRILDRVDLILYDLKIMDDKKHILFTGKSNEGILDNLRKLAESGKNVSIRIPLIKKVNDDDRNITLMAEFLNSMKKIHRINLLPYHDGGSEKQKRLRKDPGIKKFQTPSSQRINRIKKMLSEFGFSVSIGG